MSNPYRNKLHYLITGINLGFQIDFDVVLKSATVNCSSAHEHPDIIDKYLSDEINVGRIFGLSPQPPLPNLYLIAAFVSFLRRANPTRGG